MTSSIYKQAKRVLLITLALLALGVSEAHATDYSVMLPSYEAVSMVRRSGGAVHSCERVALRHFRCQATYWLTRHEAEEVEPGVWVEVAAEPFPEELQVEVGLKGVRVG
jgi:hypothetical protein